jgi:cytochrome oxidase assembly protein ShyY1
VQSWQFALTKRWFGYLALAIAFAISCVLLGQWQLDRRAEAVAAIDRVARNYDARPLPLTDVLRTTTAFTDSQEWTPVILNGTYLSSAELLVRNRTLDVSGAVGFEVLTPLKLDDGRVFIIDRGWIPTGSQHDTPDSVPVAPVGEVRVIARLARGEPTLTGKSAPAGQIATINLPTISRLIGTPTYTGAYGLMASESPSAATRPVASSKPTPDEGPHLSYAVQWFVFALFGFLGLGYALRQEYRLINAEDPEERERAAQRNRRAEGREPSDSDVEDAIVDAYAEQSR